MIPPRFRTSELQAVGDEEHRQQHWNQTTSIGEQHGENSINDVGLQGSERASILDGDEEIDEMDQYVNVCPVGDPTNEGGLIDEELQLSCSPPVQHSASPSFAILRVFEFDSRFQRMSVIVKNRETDELKVSEIP